MSIARIATTPSSRWFLLPILLSLVGCGGFVIMLTGNAEARMVVAPPGDSPCPQLSRGVTTCQDPHALSSVERSLPFHPVDPTQAFATTAGLSLTSLFTVRSLTAAAGATHTIVYGFGRLRYGFDVSSSPSRRGALLTERYNSKQLNQLFRIVPLAGQKPASTTYGPWKLAMTIPKRHLSFALETNLPVSVLRRLGRALRSRASP